MNAMKNRERGAAASRRQGVTTRSSTQASSSASGTLPTPPPTPTTRDNNGNEGGGIDGDSDNSPINSAFWRTGRTFIQEEENEVDEEVVIPVEDNSNLESTSANTDPTVQPSSTNDAPASVATTVTSPSTATGTTPTTNTTTSPSTNTTTTVATNLGTTPSATTTTTSTLSVNTQPTINNPPVINLVSQEVQNASQTSNINDIALPVLGNENEAIFARGIPESSGPPRKLPPLPSFTNTNDGEVICLGILQLAKLTGYDKSLLHGQRSKWFTAMIPQWILPGGILHGFSKPHRKTLSTKFKNAEKMARELMGTRLHQPDSTGARDESLPLWMPAFRDYLTFAAENPSARIIQQRAALRREVVTRTLIGHQPGLSLDTSALYHHGSVLTRLGLINSNKAIVVQ
jgi:hypothetical protein